MTNPHYQRITTMYRKYFQPNLLRWNWLIVVGIVGLLCLQGTLQLLGWLPFMLFGFITVLGIETARFVAVDRQQPVYEMTLLTPVPASVILDGYRQVAFMRTAHWFGLNPKLLAMLVSVSYLILAVKMYWLIDAEIATSFEPDTFFNEQLMRKLFLILFTAWTSLLFSTVTYYLLVIEVNIELGLRFNNWLLALGSGIITTVLVLLSSFIVVGIATFITSLFAYLNEFIPSIVIILMFCMYPLYWRNVFKGRALNLIRPTEKAEPNYYVDVA